MIDVWAVVDKLLSAISITRSASELNDEINDDKNSTKKSDSQDQEAIVQQRQDEMRESRAQQAKAEQEENHQSGQRR